MEGELIEVISIVQSSENIEKILNYLENRIKTPTKIAKALNLSQANVSRTLKKLMKYGLVECLNPDKKIGRLYIITDLGKQALQYAKT
ncbi:bacterial regulatory protein, arsR family [Methanobrevibacter cuticularis]|uniref:Bacterial regulatory protein, arsR family n=1 Tax=Methanobrevibacter cuticularis TaxID=47311 RepID=A0A166D142_9EURY|nr:helix-turn-helix domain-containing protein [Methanobrevibacter cuticularis]KZX15092.1 bacterial regulatory protein, arsR family [Methanobrevibacter cuticularis]